MRWVSSIVILVLCAELCLGEVINVPGNQPTIQAGINATENGDTVLVAPGTYYENIDFKGLNIVLASLYLTSGDDAYVSSTIIDGNMSGSVVTFDGREDSTASIIGFTIQNGFTVDYGGGIYCGENSNPTISNNVITGNESENNGAGISCRMSSPIIRDNTISYNYLNNIYWGAGGGIYCYNSTCRMENNEIIGNFCYCGSAGISCWASEPAIVGNTVSQNSTIGSGGGIHLHDCLGTISDNVVTGNSSGGRGAGIACWSASPSIENNIIRDNTSNFDGGGISNMYSFPVIANNTISGNSASGKGGGIYAWPAWSPKNSPVSGNVIDQNSAFQGGGMYCEYSDLPIVNNTITRNSASEGGAIYSFYSSPVLENTIIAFNDGGGSIVCSPESHPSLACCDVYGNEGGDWIDCIAEQATIDGNFSLDPEFCGIETGDFRITKGSSCAPVGNSCEVVIGAGSVGCEDVKCGDVDVSGGVDIDDIVYLVGYIFADGPAPDPYESGDVDCSGGIDIDDVVYLIGYIFSGGPEPCADCPL